VDENSGERVYNANAPILSIAESSELDGTVSESLGGSENGGVQIGDSISFGVCNGDPYQLINQLAGTGIRSTVRFIPALAQPGAGGTPSLTLSRKFL
jgi:hypothetical protein